MAKEFSFEEAFKPTKENKDKKSFSFEDAVKQPSAGFSLKDLALAFGQGVAGTTQSLSDLAGAENVVSKKLSGIQQLAGETMTPERQAEIQRRQQLEKAAEGNTWEEIKAKLGGVGEAPLQTLAQAAGSMVPYVAGTLLAPQAAIPAAAARLTGLGMSAKAAQKVASALPAATIGGAVGLGGQKGQDYATVKQELLDKGVPEAEAERLAQKAAEYSLQNLPRQAASTATGALEGAIGAEALLGRAVKKPPQVQGKPIKMDEPTWKEAIAKSTVGEALPEGVQSAVSTAGTNVALTEAGVPTDIGKGVLSSAVRDSVVGGMMGAAVSPLKMRELRQEFVGNEFEAQKEYARQQREEIAAAKKRLEEQLEMTKNPLGVFTMDELGPDLTKTIEQHRASTGKPALTSYALDDIIDALPGTDKVKETTALNALIAAKSGYNNEVYTPAQIIEAAQAKNVDTAAPSFADFLSRTTGVSDPMQMSQPQLHAAIASLNKLPGFSKTQALPEGTNATRYSAEQLTMAIDGLNAKMDALGKDELSFKETTQTIEAATGLKGSAVNALLNDANRSGRIVTENKKVSVPSRAIPTGYGISEEVGPEQEVADAYEIMRGDEKLFSAPDEKSASDLVSKLERTTSAELKRVEAELKAIDEKTAKSEDELNKLTIEGKFGTPEYKAAEKAHQALMDASMPTIAELVAKKESYSIPLEVVPTGVKKVKPKSYVVRKGDEIQTVAQDRAAAEQAIFQDLSDADLQDLAKRPSPALQQRVNAEIQRRAALPAAGAPATAATPEQQAQLDKLKVELPALLSKFGLKDVGLKIVDAIEGGADGSYQAKLIQIALSAEQPITTLRHEAIHALKELGFFTPQQWSALERQAEREWVQKYLKNVKVNVAGQTMSRYDAYANGVKNEKGDYILNPLTKEALLEEAIADAFADFDVNKAPPGMLTALLNKLRNFFAALRNALTGNGFQTYEDVFGKVERGELKGTAPAVGGEAKKSLQISEEQRAYKLNVEREQRKMARTASLTEEENAAVIKDAEKLGLSEDKVDEIIDTIIADKKRYPATQGWANLKVIGIDSKTDENGNVVANSETPKYAPIPYGYNVPPKATKAPIKVDQVWLGKVTDKFQKLVEDLYARAEKGDVTAKNIIAHQTWYKNVAATLRQEYGGFGDTLADLLGATSPNTPVDTNWRFSIDVMRRFVRGDFDAEMAKFVKHIDSGKSPSTFPTADKIRQISGKLYGMNSTNAMLALADTWRAIKPGQAPKARNFALNLIGQSNMATIDVWAARMLRRAANMVKGADFPRIPPPAEQGVSGTWNADATKVTGAFGFGADVMQKVSDNLAAKGLNIAPPDLQAIAWFAEKELWTKKNWTNKAGEGGSFEENIEGQPAERYIAGHSIQVGEQEPESEEIKAVQNQLTNLLSKDKSVIAFRVQDTSGLYGGTVEKSFDTEVVAEKGFDPEPMVEMLANISKENNQYDIFISKVVGPKEDNLNARPGVEIYFKTQQDMAKILPILKRFTSRGQDGFTLAVDPRVNEPTGQYIGVRLQYVPEISMRWDEGLRQKLLIPGQLERILKGKTQLLNNIIAEVSAMEGVAHAAMARYDTLVIGRENYDDYTHGRVTTGNQATPKPIWFGEPIRKHVERAVTRLRGDQGQVGTGSLPSVDETQGERKLSLKLETEAAQKSENLRGIISDKTLDAVQRVLNTYTEKPQNLNVTPEQRAKAEQALLPYVNKAKAIKPKFDQQIRDIAAQVDGEARIPGLKGLGRAAEKLATEYAPGVDGNPVGSNIMDLLRATIVVNSESQIQPTIELIKKKFPQVLRIKDRFTNPQDTGYRDVLMNVKLPNGLAVEIQLNIPEMIKAKTSGHVLYAMSRNLEEGSQQRIELDSLARDLYGEAYRFSQNAISPESAGSALRNISRGTGMSGRVAKTTEPSLSSKMGDESKAQTLAPSGILNIPVSSKETSIDESKKSLKSVFRSPEAAENAAYKKAPPITEAFKRWFGGSVLTEEGRPMVMYHGSPNEFSIFSENKPIFVSPNPNDAEFFAALKRLGRKQGKPYIYPLWVRAEKPFDFENPDHVQQIMDYMATNYTSPENANRIQVYGHGYKNADELASRLQRGDWTYIESANVQDALQALGFDSFHVLEGGKKNLAVFSANQVKSATGNLGDYSESKDIRFSLRQVDDFFNKAENIKEPEGVEIIRENWIGSVSGLGDRDSAYDLYRVRGGKQYMDNVQNLIRQSFGDEFKGYRLMHIDELEEIKVGAMGSQLASFTLRPDIAKAFANLATFRNIPKDQLKVIEMDLTPEHVVMIGHPGERELVVDYGQGYNPDAVVEYQPSEKKLSLRSVKDEVDSLPNGAAINSSINRIAPAREEEGFFERIMNAFKPQSVDALRQQWLNRYNQLGVYDKLLAEKMGGAALLADASAESAALMSDNAAAIAAMACGIEGNGGVPVYDNGFTTISNANGEKGVLEILMPLAKIGDPRIYQTYQFWAGSKRGKRLLDNGKDHTYTAAEIAYAAELEQKYPEFKQVQKDWIEYNNGLMKYAVATGVLAKERAAEFMRYSDYIPFYRQLDGQDTIGPKLFQNISGVTPPKKLKGIKEGQEAPLADFLETVVRNTQSIIQAGMKNTAAQRAVGVAVQLNQAQKRNDVSYAPGVVTVLEKGKPVSYDVADQLFIDAVKSLNLPELPFLSIFSAPANLLRNMITKDPGFMMANLMRDSLSAWVTSGAKMTPIASTISNFGKAIGGKDPVYLALRRAGVIGGYEFAQDIQTSGSVLGAALRRESGTERGAEKALKPFTSLWRGLEKGTEASDAATRMAVYKATLERTGNEAEAIFRAMEVLNFNRKGNLAIVRILTAAVPFLNARMQGLDVFYRAAFGKMASEDAAAIQKSFFIRGATLMALTAMYWFLTHDDEEYLKQEQETRDNNWLFPSAGIRIPIPFEVGVLFKTIPERLLEYSFGNDTGKDLADSMKRNLVSTFGINPIPQTVLPIVEARTNYSFFTMRPIVGQGMEGVAKEYQVAPGTSEMAKKIGKMLGESPIMVDHLIKGYTGSMGMYAVDLIDAILLGNDASPKVAKRFEQMPVIKRFALDKEAKGTVTAYYELKNSVDEVVRTVNLMERTGNADDLGEYMEKNAQLFGMRSYISSVESQMKVMREAAIQIRSSDMSPEEKRESLSAITEAQNAMTSSIRELKKTISQ